MEAEGADGASGGAEAALSCFSFNQDCTSLAIGTKAGYKLFSLSSVEQLDHVHGSNDTPDVYIVERLFSSSLVVVVSHTKPRQMNVYHFKKGTEICNYSYSGNILAIRLNRQRLLVCLEESIYIHNIKDMKLLKTILDIPANPTGLCALSINHSNSYVAYPGSLTTGEIVLYDGHSLKPVCTIAAHEGTLAAIAFNSSGSRLASASEKVRDHQLPGFQHGLAVPLRLQQHRDCAHLQAGASRQQPTRGALNLDRLHGEDVPGCIQLPPHPGVRHDEPGQGLRHRASGLLRPQEHLHPRHDPEAAAAPGRLVQWAPLRLQPGPSGRRRLCPNQDPQVKRPVVRKPGFQDSLLRPLSPEQRGHGVREVRGCGAGGAAGVWGGGGGGGARVRGWGAGPLGAGVALGCEVQVCAVREDARVRVQRGRRSGGGRWGRGPGVRGARGAGAGCGGGPECGGGGPRWVSGSRWLSSRHAGLSLPAPPSPGSLGRVCQTERRPLLPSAGRTPLAWAPWRAGLRIPAWTAQVGAGSGTRDGTFRTDPAVGGRAGPGNRRGAAPEPGARPGLPGSSSGGVLGGR
uniref:WD repeat domain, phosphoinositide interacting 1 n=1 Tax=Bos indicus x Bos taurus TaxID=30522 RepID=A0A4W2D096_BOBOX